METIHRKHCVSNKPCVNYMVPALPDRRNVTSHRRCPLHTTGLSKAQLNRRVYTEILHIITTYKGCIIGDSPQRCIGNRLHGILQVDSPEQPHTSENTNKTNPIQTADRWMRHIEAPRSLSNNLWVETMLKKKSVINVRPVSVGIYGLLTSQVAYFPHLPQLLAPGSSIAGVAITNISMQLALLYSELDYLTYNPTSRHGTGYTFTWPRPTVEPVWLFICNSIYNVAKPPPKGK